MVAAGAGERDGPDRSFVRPFHPKERFVVNFFGHTESIANLPRLKRSSKTLIFKSLLPMFSFKSFMGLGYTLRYLIHSELILVCGGKTDPVSFFCM